MFNKIFNTFIKLLDRKQAKINLILDEEISNGGEFEKLVFPIPELNKYQVIQFFRNRADFGIVSGLGSDPVLEMAYLKAMVEYFERLSFFKNEKAFGLRSTNGIATHKIGEIAKEAAKDELIERDAFLLHWYSNSPFTSLELSIEEIELNKILSKNKLEIKLGKTSLGLKETYLCFLVDQTTEGFALGLSVGRGNKDREKAIMEALINYFFGHLGNSRDELLASLERDGVKTLLEHRTLWLYKQPMPSWIFNNETLIIPQVPFKDQSFNFNLLESSPFTTYHCYNDELLSLDIGKISERSIELLTKKSMKVVCGTTEYHPIP